MKRSNDQFCGVDGLSLLDASGAEDRFIVQRTVKHPAVVHRTFAARSILTWLLAVFIAGCGGGGGGGGTTTEVITAASAPQGTTFVPYPGYAFMASGGGVQPFSWTESGALPDGLVLSSSGQLAGTPSRAGTYSFVVTVADASIPPLTAQAHVSIMINDSAIIVATSPPPPDGTLNQPYPAFGFAASGGSPPYSWQLTSGSLPPGLMMASDGSVSGIPASAGTYSFSVTATDSVQPPETATAVAMSIRTSPARPPALFTLTGSMTIPRSDHAATLLNTGKVLVTGGNTGKGLLTGGRHGQPDATAELYDPAMGLFVATGPMTEARSSHTATLLGDALLPNYGKVLIVGSVDTTAELYDPATGAFTATGRMTHARNSPTATFLSTGKVLIVGGNTTAGDLAAELYDPATETFNATGRTTILRVAHTATRLLDGRVLIAGGATSVGPSITAELYDPLSGTFSSTNGSMSVARSGHTATLLQHGLQDGTVLIIGTDGASDLYDPSTGQFTSAGSWFALTGRTASLRNDGTVLVAGGLGPTAPVFCGPLFVSTNVAALFATDSDGFTVTGDLNIARDRHTATVLSDGTVLIVGGGRTVLIPVGFGCPGTSILSSAELFK